MITTSLLCITLAFGQVDPTDPGQGRTDPNADYSNELPRSTPLSPAESLKQLTVLDGFRVELVAHEPLVVDPVAMAFDESAALFVVCMRGYSEQGGDFLGQVRRLVDHDGDGFYDASTVFVDHLSWPTAVLPWDGGVFIGAAPYIFYAKDHDGDGHADSQKVVFSGFSRSNVQGLLNSFRWGLDNRIHGSASRSGGHVQTVGETHVPITLNRRNFAFNPRDRVFVATSGGAQHGFSFDDWGHKFLSANSRHLQMVFAEEHYLKRNLQLAVESTRRVIALDGAKAEVYRQSPVEPWRIVRTRLRRAGVIPGPIEGGGRAAGYFTAATGAMIYRGNAWPAEMRGQVFVGDVGSNILHRKQLTRRSVGFDADRIDPGREFLSSTETWFRPVQTANAPDGTLYVLDMYREFVEHPLSLAPVIKKHLDLTSGQDRGRIYRVVPSDFVQPPPARLDRMTTTQLVPLLASRNSWHRETAARLIYTRQERSAATPLRKLLGHDEPLARLHAMYALRGLNELSAAVIAPLLRDSHPRVREHAIRLAEPFVKDSAHVRSALYPLADDPDINVRYQLAFTLGETTDGGRTSALARIAARDPRDEWIQVAVLSSLSEGLGELFTLLMHKRSTYRKLSSGNTQDFDELLGVLGQQLARKNDASEVAAALATIDTVPAPERRLARTIVRELSLASSRHGTRLETFLAERSKQAPAILRELVEAARETIEDTSQSVKKRVSALRTLQLSALMEERERIGVLLGSRAANALQIAALRTLSHYSSSKVAEVIIDAWPGLSPRVRNSASEVLFQTESRLDVMLRAMGDGRIAASALDGTRRQMLRNHHNENIRAAAEDLLDKLAVPRRPDVLARYAEAMSLTGNTARGKATFLRTCAPCHRVENQGHELGPRLAALRNRGPETILVNVLDPNREVDPAYVNYVVVTTDGHSITGIVAEETAASLTLKRAEGQVETVLRDRIATLQNTGLSIMPEGLEKQIDVQAMADLIAYLLALR